jgi:hypothetical protein
LLEQLRQVLRYRHYSLKTEKAYLYWVRFFIRWSGQQGPLRHPRDLGANEVRAFLTMLATDRKVSVSTHNPGAERAAVSLSRSAAAPAPMARRHSAADAGRAHSFGAHAA